MKLIKGNQIIVIAIAILLMVVGYINYNGQIQSVQTSSLMDVTDNFADSENIGDVQLVSSVSTDSNENMQSENNEENKNSISNEETESTGAGRNSKEFENSNISDNNEKFEDETLVSSSTTDEYFENSRIQRDKMYSEQLDTYQKMLNSEAISNEQKAIASKEIENISNEKKAILITENLIKTKGFEDVIIYVNDKSVSVIIKKEKLDEAEVAQLQNIITRELNVEMQNINISNKK